MRREEKNNVEDKMRNCGLFVLFYHFSLGRKILHENYGKTTHSERNVIKISNNLRISSFRFNLVLLSFFLLPSPPQTFSRHRLRI